MVPGFSKAENVIVGYTSGEQEMIANLIFVFAFALRANEKNCDSISMKRGKKFREVDYSSQERELCQICSQTSLPQPL